MRPALLVLLLPLAACAPLQPMESQEPPKPVVHTVVKPIYIPTPVACFTENERPIFPTPTPIDVAVATPEQKAAAESADSRALQMFARAVDALFVQCLEATKRILPKGNP